MDKPKTKPCFVKLEPVTPELQSSLSLELRKVINERNMLTTRTKKKILLDLDEINDTNLEIDRQIHRMQAVKEILLSEVSYLKQLELILNYFMKPIEKMKILNQREFQTVFGDIQTIYNINGELLQELKRNPDNIAKAFSNIAPFFKLYSVYAYNYKNSLDMLQKVSSINQKFSKFLQQQESRPEVQTKLSALLITPIQRVPRYRLLLKQILDNTHSKQPTYLLLKDSLLKIEEAAIHINNLVDDQENTQRLLELQRSLQNNYPLIIKPGRKLIKEGLLLKMGKNNDSKKTYLVLLSDIVLYCKLKKENPNTANSLKCSGILPLNKCKIAKMLNKGAFNITCDDESYVFYHNSALYIEEWVETLNTSIKSYIKNRLTLRKDNSYRKPAHKKLMSEFQDLGVSPGQPRKKRQSYEQANVGNTPNVSYDSSFESQNCFSFLSLKRKGIENNDLQPSKKQKCDNTKPRDSLFPLRAQNHGETIQQASTDCDDNVNKLVQNATEEATSKACEVFVFGRNRPPRGFHFNIGNMLTDRLTDLGHSVKRMFGFGEN